MGFSSLGLVVSIAVLAPNLLLLRFPPRGRRGPAHVPRALEWLERAGQALCLVVPAITEPGNIVWWWALPAAGALVAYYALWTRYLVGGCRVSLLYDRVWLIPVPMAILPVVTFLATAAWLGNLWIAVSALVLATGHIPVAVITSRNARLTN
ncbi:hypothetical protein [Pseudonocardia endophytica]|uniref:Uncharacterized protein n=1 Tax=Pseudonocardia endophytica TaxID=401976 RepID=A0A4V2PIH3_PSEEN|nr:hypothetical protein [Pseudonocardia endophytica]TCK24606.1 hypothetical protein EV378_0380 [Pseudonocardia endophytica]